MHSVDRVPTITKSSNATIVRRATSQSLSDLVELCQGGVGLLLTSGVFVSGQKANITVYLFQTGQIRSPSWEGVTATRQTTISHGLLGFGGNVSD